MQKYITWTCANCKRKNQWEMHEPDAHFPSMVCDHCGHEIEMCLCDLSSIPLNTFRTWGAQGGKKKGKSKVRGDSEYYRKIAKRRKKKSTK